LVYFAGPEATIIEGERNNVGEGQWDREESKVSFTQDTCVFVLQTLNLGEGKRSKLGEWERH
jgi:hypothetical protein